MFRVALARQVVVEATVSREVCEDMILCSKIQKVRWGKTIEISLIIRNFTLENADQLPRFGIGQRLYHHRVNDTEDGNGRPNSQPESEDDGCGKSSILREPTERLAKFAELHKLHYPCGAGEIPGRVAIVSPFSTNSRSHRTTRCQPRWWSCAASGARANPLWRNRTSVPPETGSSSQRT